MNEDHKLSSVSPESISRSALAKKAVAWLSDPVTDIVLLFPQVLIKVFTLVTVPVIDL